MKKRRPTIYKHWTPELDAWLIANYAERSNADLAEWLHRSPRAIQLRAHKLGVQKSPEFAEKQRKANQFRKGHTPFNKGREMRYWMSPEGVERSSRGRFAPGTTRDDNPNSRKNKPIGHEKMYSDGYIWVITEHGRVQKHRHIWEQAYGPIPPNHCIRFKDGDRTNCALDNLYMVSRADHARITLSTFSPEKWKEIHEKVQQKRNKSIRRDRLLIKWGLEPEGRLVKRI